MLQSIESKQVERASCSVEFLLNICLHFVLDFGWNFSPRGLSIQIQVASRSSSYTSEKSINILFFNFLKQKAWIRIKKQEMETDKKKKITLSINSLKKDKLSRKNLKKLKENWFLPPLMFPPVVTCNRRGREDCCWDAIVTTGSWQGKAKSRVNSIGWLLDIPLWMCCSLVALWPQTTGWVLSVSVNDQRNRGCGCLA